MYVKYVYFKSNVYDYYMIVQLYIHSNLLICVIVLLTNATGSQGQNIVAA